jgi:Xaa-Pro aminopeptidase
MKSGSAEAAGPVIDADENRRRVEAAAAMALSKGLDGLLIWGRGGALDALSDLHYFSGHFSPGVWVPPSPPGLVACEHGCLLIDSGGATTLLATEYVSDRAVADRIVRGWDLGEVLVDAIREHGLSRASVGIVGEEVMPFSIGRRLEAELPDLTLSGSDDIGTRLRRRLSDREQEVMLHAGSVGSGIYDALSEGMVEGQTEGEAIGRGWAQAARTPGCAHWNFLAASGPDADVLVKNAIPSWNPQLAYRPGDVTHIDCFGLYQGYYYDLARTFVVGEEPLPEPYRGAQRACHAMAAALRPGVTATELHALGMRALSDSGHEPVMGSFGHGIGAGFFPPYITPGLAESDWGFEPPIGVAIEVLARDAEGRVSYHEDDYVLTEDGVVRLTRTRGE